jgi:hypothetical protein
MYVEEFLEFVHYANVSAIVTPSYIVCETPEGDMPTPRHHSDHTRSIASPNDTLNIEYQNIDHCPTPVNPHQFQDIRNTPSNNFQISDSQIRISGDTPLREKALTATGLLNNQSTFNSEIDSPDKLKAMSCLAATYRSQGRYNESEELGLQVLEGTKNIMSAGNPDTLQTMSLLAVTYHSQGRYSESEELGLQVLEGRKNTLGVGHPDTLRTMSLLAATYRSQGRYGESEELGLQVLEGRKNILGVGHPDTLRAMSNLAGTYWSQGRYSESEELGLQVCWKEQRI